MTTKERMDGLVDLSKLRDLNMTIIELTERLLEDGFDGDEIALYLRKNIADAIVVVENNHIEKEAKKALSRIKRR